MTRDGPRQSHYLFASSRSNQSRVAAMTPCAISPTKRALPFFFGVKLPTTPLTSISSVLWCCAWAPPAHDSGSGSGSKAQTSSTGGSPNRGLFAARPEGNQIKREKTGKRRSSTKKKRWECDLVDSSRPRRAPSVYLSTTDLACPAVPRPDRRRKPRCKAAYEGTRAPECCLACLFFESFPLSSSSPPKRCLCQARSGRRRSRLSLDPL